MRETKPWQSVVSSSLIYFAVSNIWNLATGETISPSQLPLLLAQALLFGILFTASRFWIKKFGYRSTLVALFLITLVVVGIGLLLVLWLSAR